MALNEQPQFVNARVPAVHLQQGESLAKLRRRSLRVARKAFQNRVIGLHRLGELELLVSDLAQIEVGAAGQIIQWIEVNHILKFARRDFVFGSVIVAQAGLECLRQGRSLIVG